MRINIFNSQIRIKNNSFNILNKKRNVDYKIAEYNFSSYPYNYYLSFKAKKTPKNIIKEVGEENFPSKQILQDVKNAYKNDADFLLYDAHIDYYKNLLECKTLDEAKEMYPEFQDVIDAKDVDYKDMSYTLKQILRGESSLKIEDLSLELLKKYYGQVFPISTKKEEYFGFGKKAICGLFKILNIPFMNEKYLSIVYRQKPEYINNAALKTQEYYKNHPERRSQHSEFMKEYCARSDVKEKMRSKRYDKDEREYMSLIRKKYYKEHPDAGKDHGQVVRQSYIEHPEKREMMSERIRKFYSEHPEYNVLKRYVYKKIFPDYVEIMSQTAKEFPAIGAIRHKEEMGIPLNEYEKSYNRQYFAKCAKQFPNIGAQVASSFSYLVKMFGISPECDSERKIEELNEFFNNDKKVKELMLQIRGNIIE